MPNIKDSSDNDRKILRDEGHTALGERWLQDESMNDLRQLAEELVIPGADKLSREELIHAVYSARRSCSTLDSHNSRR